MVVVGSCFWEDAWLLVTAGQGGTQRRDSETWRDSLRVSEGEAEGKAGMEGVTSFKNTSVSFFQRK